MAMQRCCRQPWIILLCSVIFGGTFVYTEIVIEKPRDVIAYRDEPFAWDCHVTVTGSQSYEIVWIFEGEILNDTYRFALSNGSLYISNVQLHRDNGYYRCCGKNGTWILCSREARLSVADLPQFKTQPQQTVAYLGGVARFECEIDGVPKANITWKHKRIPVRVDQERIVLLPNGVLQIHRVLQSDKGLYRCVANNAVRSRSSQEVLLNILPQDTSPIPAEEANIVHGPSSRSVVQGEDILLECLAEGWPLRVTWSRKDGTPIREEGVSYPGGSNLLIKKARFPLDNATYRCKATNPDTGKSQIAEAAINIMTPPVFDVVPDTLYKVIGSRLRFFCSATGNPTPVISWLHNGRPALLDDYHNHMLPDNDYVVSQFWWEDEGVYQCEARNLAGTVISSGAAIVRPVSDYPTPIRNLTVDVLSSTALRIAWSPPKNFTSSLVGYNVECRPMIENGNQLSIFRVLRKEFLSTNMCNNLLPYTEYRVTVQCFIIRAPCPRAVAYVRTDEDVPTMWPEFSAASESPTSITVTWDSLPEQSANGVIISYLIRFKLMGSETFNSTAVDGQLREYVIEGLKPRSNYSIRMLAGTALGYGPGSSWLTVSTPEIYNESTPKPPHMQVSHVNHTTLKVAFRPNTPPPVTLGFKIFVFNSGESLGDPILLPINITQYIVTNLEPKEIYTVRMMGYNEFGDGRCSAQTILMPDPPDPTLPPVGPPYPFEINATSTAASTILLQWVHPMTDKHISGYTIRYKMRGANETHVVDVDDGKTHRYLLRTLLPFTEYEYSIRSIGISGLPGDFSPRARILTLEDRPSDPPSAVHASPLDPHTVEVKWQPPAKPNGIITHYTVMYQMDVNLPEEKWECEQKNGTAHQSMIEKLSSGTRYYFKVKAGTQAGDGPPTDAVAAQTLPATDPRDTTPSENLQRGILIGVGLSLFCILICTALITYKFRHVCKRNRGPPPCNCPPSNGATCVHYWANGGSQRVYMMVPLEEESTDVNVPVMRRNEHTVEGTPQMMNGHGPKWNHCNGHAPLVMNGYGPTLANGHCPNLNGREAAAWQNKIAFLPPDLVGSSHDDMSSRSSASIPGVALHNTQEDSNQDMPDCEIDCQDTMIPPHSSTSYEHLGTKSLTSSSHASSQKFDSSRSSHNSISNLPPTDPMSASITTPSMGQSSNSGVKSHGAESCGGGHGGGSPDNAACHGSTSQVTTHSHNSQKPNLPRARRVDPQRVLMPGRMQVGNSIGREQSYGDPWERTPPGSKAGSSQHSESECSDGNGDSTTHRSTEENKTVKVCTV